MDRAYKKATLQAFLSGILFVLVFGYFYFTPRGFFFFEDYKITIIFTLSILALFYLLVISLNFLNIYTLNKFFQVINYFLAAILAYIFCYEMYRWISIFVRLKNITFSDMKFSFFLTFFYLVLSALLIYIGKLNKSIK